MKKRIYFFIIALIYTTACNDSTASFNISTKITTENVESLISSNDWRIRYQAASFEELSLLQFKKLAEDENYLVRSQILTHDNVELSILEKLSSSNDWYVLYRVAKYPLTPAYILERLAENSSPHVKKAVAKNANTSAETLKKIANHNNWQVRLSVISNNNVPIQILWDWFQSPSHFVKKELVYNLAQNDKTCIRFFKYLQSIGEMDVYNKIALEVVSYSNAHPKNLQWLANSEEWEILLEIAKNPNSPTDVLEKLSLNEDVSIRAEIASNSSTSVETLKKLIDVEEDDDVKQEAIENLASKQGN